MATPESASQLASHDDPIAPDGRLIVGVIGGGIAFLCLEILALALGWVV